MIYSYVKILFLLNIKIYFNILRTLLQLLYKRKGEQSSETDSSRFFVS